MNMMVGLVAHSAGHCFHPRHPAVTHAATGRGRSIPEPCMCLLEANQRQKATQTMPFCVSGQCALSGEGKRGSNVGG